MSRSARHNRECHYSCGDGAEDSWGLAHHFPTAAQQKRCFLAATAWPDQSRNLDVTDETLYLQGNSSVDGLGTRLEVCITANRADLIVRHVHMSGLMYADSAAGGGAISMTQGTLIVEHSTFEGNHAHQSRRILGTTDAIPAHSGGAILVQRATEVFISHSSFVNNHADGSGGALYVANAIGRVTISDCSFDKNDADMDGSAIAIDISAKGDHHVGFLEPISIVDCVGAGNAAVSGSAVVVKTADGVVHVPEKDLAVGGDSRWGQVVIEFADGAGCSLMLSTHELDVEGVEEACTGEHLAADTLCTVKCALSVDQPCAYGGETQQVSCAGIGGGAVQLIRSGSCFGPTCAEAGVDSKCQHGATCCALANDDEQMCECPVDYRFGDDDKHCDMDRCDVAEAGGETLCYGGECVQSSDAEKDFHDCRYSYVWRMFALVVCVLCSVVCLFPIIRGFRRSLQSINDDDTEDERGQVEAVGWLGGFGLVLGALGLAIKIGQTISLLEEEIMWLVFCNLGVLVVTVLVTWHFQVQVLSSIEADWSNAKDWRGHHSLWMLMVRLFSMTRLHGLAILRWRIRMCVCCGKESTLSEMPMHSKYWRFLRDSSGYLYLIADVPHLTIAVATLCIQWETAESKRVCADQATFFSESMCGWMPSWLDAPAEGSQSLFAYLSILRALISLLSGFIGWLVSGYCCKKTAVTDQDDLSASLLDGTQTSPSGRLASSPSAYGEITSAGLNPSRGSRRPSPATSMASVNGSVSDETILAGFRGSRPASPVLARGSDSYGSKRLTIPELDDALRNSRSPPEPEPEALARKSSFTSVFEAGNDSDSEPRAGVSRAASPGLDDDDEDDEPLLFSPSSPPPIALFLVESQAFGLKEGRIDPIDAKDLKEFNAKLGVVLGLERCGIEIFDPRGSRWREPKDVQEVRENAGRARLFKGRKNVS